MHLFFVDKDLVVTKRLDRGYLMQYSDGVDMVFFAMDGADAYQPKNQTAHLYGQTLDTKKSQILMMDWTSFEYGGKKLWGWCTTIPSTFTQVAGTLYLNCVVTEITNLDTNEGVEHVISTCELTVNESGGESAWTDAINYAQWKELISYFINSNMWEDYVTLATDQTITGYKTFANEIKVTAGGYNTYYTSGYINKDDDVFWFPERDGTLAITKDVSESLATAKAYSLSLYNKCVTLSDAQTITGEKTFENDIKINDTNTTLILKTNGIQTGDNVFTFPVKEAGEYVFALTADVTSCLETAEKYADEKVSAEASSRETGDTNTLTEAKKYTDEQIAGIDHSKYVTTNTAQTISGTKTFEAPIQMSGSNNIRFFGSNTGIVDERGSRIAGWLKDTTSTYWVVVGNSSSKLQFLGTATRPIYNGTDMALSSDIHVTAENYYI